ncbi:MAG TPA: hypothetical protein VIU83_06480 [Candidatus Deferrimicrobium sp.]
MGGESAVKVCTLLFLALFSWPFLGALDFPATFLGVPSFLAAVFLLWGVLVYALIAASRRGRE